MKYLNTYNSLSELSRVLKSTIDVKTKSTYSKEIGGYGFRGTNSLEEAIDLLTKGDKDMIAKIKELTNKYIKADSHISKRYIPETTGLFFDVAKVIEGIPEAWYQPVEDKQSQPIIWLEVNIGYPSNVKTETVLDNGALLLSKIKMLESQGYLIGLKATSSVSLLGDTYTVAVIVKQPDTPVNYQSLSGVLHPSFLRRLVFRVRELGLPTKDLFKDSYGTSIMSLINISKRHTIEAIGVSK